MKVVLTYCTPDPENVIANAAAICFDADTSTEANSKRMDRIIKLGHFSPLRFANASFHISEISRITSHQLVRTAHMGIMQRSQRYTISDSEFAYEEPDSIATADEYFVDGFNNLVTDAHNFYLEMIAAGIPKEDARYILPQCTHTEMNLAANFQAWRYFLKARLSEGAQWEIKSVAQEIKAALTLVAPTVFGDL